MPAQVFEPGQPVPCQSLAVLIYGPPGAGKTTLAQTADHPFTLDFDRGIHRASGTKGAARFDRWADLQQVAPHLAACRTVVVDTVGRMLDLLTADIVAQGRRGEVYGGALSLQGWGVLKGRFQQWLASNRTAGKDTVFLAHDREEKDGEARVVRPDIQGSSFGEVMKVCDLVGLLTAGQDGRRMLNFNPSERSIGKNCVGWKALPVDGPDAAPDFLARLLRAAKSKLSPAPPAPAVTPNLVVPAGPPVEESDDLKALRRMVSRGPSLDDLNGVMRDLAGLSAADKKTAWDVIKEFALRAQLVWDPAAKKWAFPGDSYEPPATN